MKTIYDKYTFKIPTWAMCYIHNADGSSLTDEEINLVDSFMSEVDIVGMPNDDDEPYFSVSNDIGGLASDVYDIECLTEIK